MNEIGHEATTPKRGPPKRRDSLRSLAVHLRIGLPRWARAALVGLLLACLAGCTSFPWQKVPLDVASGFYADATLTYRLDAGKLGQPLDVVRIEGQRVSYEQVASSPLPDESIGTLSITLPHPSGRPGLALAQFTLASSKEKPANKPAAWNPFAKDPDAGEAPTAITSTQPRVYERWELDIPRAEADRLLKLLNNEGFYHSQRAGPAHLAVKMDGVEQSKEWSEVTALNLLIQRVRTTGRLIAYARPTMADGSPPSTIASTAAYADLWARGGMPGPKPPSLASAFALPRAPAYSAPSQVAAAYPATPYSAARRGPAAVR